MNLRKCSRKVGLLKYRKVFEREWKIINCYEAVEEPGGR